MVYDSPWWRDGFITLMIIIVIFSVLLKHHKIRINKFDILIILYFIYGAWGTATSDIPPNEALKIFRSYFYVVLLYFIARYIFKKESNYYRFNKIIILIALLLATDIIIEWCFVNIFGLSRNYFPWVAYAAAHSNVQGFVSGSLSSTVRIGTFSGFPHVTLLLFGGLFIYLFPAQIYFNRRYVFKEKLGSFSRKKSGLGLMLILSICIFLGYVKLVIIMTILILIIYSIFFVKNSTTMIKYLIALVLTFSILLLSIPAILDRIGIFYDSIIFDLATYGMYPINYIKSWSFKDLYSHSFITPKMATNDPFLGPFIGEVRIIQYTISFGLIWLFLLILIFFVALKKCLKGILHDNFEKRYFFMGSFGFLVLYMADMFHYALAVTIPNVDFLLIFIAAVSSAKIHPNIVNVGSPQWK